MNRTLKGLQWLGIVGCAALALGAASPAGAQSATDIIRSLAPIAGQSIGPIPQRRPVPYVDRSGTSTTIILDYRYTYEMVVYFPFDSAELTNRAREQLYALGMALQSPSLRPYRYMIAGHTDAVGTADYNLDLSVRRSAAVVNHLTMRFGIEPWRLVSTGWGATQLKDPRHPQSGINRRTEVVLVAEPIAPAPPTSYEPPRSPRDDVSIQAVPGGPVIIRPAPGVSINVQVEKDQSAPPAQAGTTAEPRTNCPPEAVRDNAANSGTLDDFAGCGPSGLPGVPGQRIIINRP